MDKVKNEKISRKEMLADMDVRTWPDGRRRVVSVKYVEQGGKLRFFPQCTVGGAGRMNNKQWRVRGFTPCDCKGQPEDHVHPVRIFNIVEYNGRRVWNALSVDAEPATLQGSETPDRTGGLS